jgi:hypothetical protein
MSEAEMGPHEEDGFETFQESPRPPGNTPKVTISKSGAFVFNKKFRDKYWKQLKDGLVVLQYDSKGNIIRLKECPAPEYNAYRIRDLDRGLIISGKAFLQHFEIPHERSRSYEPEVEYDERYGCLIYIDLKKNSKKKEGKPKANRK